LKEKSDIERRMIGTWLLCLVILNGFAAVRSVRADDGDWIMYNYDARGTRYNSAEQSIGVSNAPSLKVKWQYATPAPVSATPVVSDGNVYAGDMAGNFFALNANGTLKWSKLLDASGITASAAVAGNLVIVGALSGAVYGLNRNDGSIAWTMRPDSHPLAAIWGSPTKIGKYIVLGVASNEEPAAGDPSYHCCSSRGSVVMLDPKNGAVVWQTFMVTDAQRSAGASGASVWSTPSYDASKKLIYVTTGNNFSQPTTLTSDAIIALDADTGVISWVNQRTPNDEWNYSFPPSPDHPDFDFGDSPQVYELPNGRRVVGAGQKSGFYHVVDAATGATINQHQVEVGGSLGGLFADSAVANGVVFANGVNWPTPGQTAPVAGDLFALSGDGSQILWTFHTQSSPDMAGVAVANGVVYLTSTYSEKLFALNASSGAVLAGVSVGHSESGPAIAHGQIYVGTGNALAAGFGFGFGPGSITALGL
jgi:polyvinyl alcohol dehydrogenase (cytochrome)